MCCSPWQGSFLSGCSLAAAVSRRKRRHLPIVKNSEDCRGIQCSASCRGAKRTPINGRDQFDLLRSVGYLNALNRDALYWKPLYVPFFEISALNNPMPLAPLFNRGLNACPPSTQRCAELMRRFQMDLVDGPWRLQDPHAFPCAAYIEIMAAKIKPKPVFWGPFRHELLNTIRLFWSDPGGNRPR